MDRVARAVVPAVAACLAASGCNEAAPVPPAVWSAPPGVLAAVVTLLALAASACAGNPAGGGDAGVDGGGSSSSGGSSGSSSGGGPPECTVDAGGEPLAAVPASGSFTGTDLSGFVCAGGAFAYLEKAQGSISVPGQLLMIIDSAFTGDPATRMQFQTPADATSGELTILSGVSAAAPGTYGSATGACGGVAFCVSLPVPAGVTCGGNSSSSCPPGCTPAGPVSAPTCVPAVPQNCYVAQAASDCVSGTQAARGSWTLTLASVEPFDGGAAAGRYVVHGSFTTTMVGDGDAGGGATLTVSF